MKIKLKDIKPNPYKKFIDNGKIDPTRVERILESAERNEFQRSFHINTKNELSLGGHHSLKAAIKIFGGDHEVEVTVHDLTDEQMFSSLANENVKDDNPQEKMDVIAFARKYLLEHPEACKAGLAHVSRPLSKKAAEQPSQHQHGSAQCVASFLGEANWPLATVKRYLVMDTLDPSVKAKVAPPTGSRKDAGHGIKPGELRQSDAVALADLTAAAQRAAVKAIAEINNEDAADPVIIPASEVKRVVNEVKNLPQEQQAKTVAEKLKEAGKEQKRVKEERKQAAPPPRVAIKQPTKNLFAMADRIIKEGQRVLASKLHPDKGGSNDEMVELNAAVTWLRSLISRL